MRLLQAHQLSSHSQLPGCSIRNQGALEATLDVRVVATFSCHSAAPHREEWGKNLFCTRKTQMHFPPPFKPCRFSCLLIFFRIIVPSFTKWQVMQVNSPVPSVYHLDINRTSRESRKLSTFMPHCCRALRWTGSFCVADTISPPFTWSCWQTVEDRKEGNGKTKDLYRYTHPTRTTLTPRQSYQKTSVECLLQITNQLTTTTECFFFFVVVGFFSTPFIIHLFCCSFYWLYNKKHKIQ